LSTMEFEPPTEPETALPDVLWPLLAFSTCNESMLDAVCAFFRVRIAIHGVVPDMKRLTGYNAAGTNVLVASQPGRNIEDWLLRAATIFVVSGDKSLEAEEQFERLTAEKIRDTTNYEPDPSSYPLHQVVFNLPGRPNLNFNTQRVPATWGSKVNEAVVELFDKMNGKIHRTGTGKGLQLGGFGQMLYALAQMSRFQCFWIKVANVDVWLSPFQQMMELIVGQSTVLSEPEMVKATGHERGVPALDNPAGAPAFIDTVTMALRTITPAKHEDLNESYHVRDATKLRKRLLAIDARNNKKHKPDASAIVIDPED